MCVEREALGTERDDFAIVKASMGGAYISRIAFKLQFRLMLLQIPDLSHPS